MKNAVEVVYRPPSKPTNCFDNLEITLANLTAEMDEIILTAIIALFDVHAPLKTISTKRPAKPYITDTIKEIIKLKDKEAYKDLKNYVSYAIKQEKAAYVEYELNACKKNSRKLWNKFSDLGVHQRKSNEIAPELTDPNRINNFFCNVPSTSIDPNLVEFFNYNRHHNPHQTLELTLVTMEEVKNALLSIKSNATGLDNISLQMLKLIFPFCGDTITHLINTSFLSGMVPKVWKKAVVVPLAKVTKATKLKELRPINLLPVTYKIVEKIITYIIMKYMNEFNILPSYRSGFRRNYSTCSALLKITSEISTALDDSQLCILTLLYYSKAFDMVNPQLLLAKLRYYGLAEAFCDWFNSYLSNRTQVVKLEDNVSSEIEMALGVPQGSSLSPILFTTFTADLPSCLSSDVSAHLYADDTQMYVFCNPQDINSAVSILTKQEFGTYVRMVLK
ncbi:uncharacterized protein LOC135125954 [Zophobas morio]|uniref:uncharacterized protein LOC135125954 n=1 Tax=Zophobas morio TaxID=2755281 RepID=UPI0030839E87